LIRFGRGRRSDYHLIPNRRITAGQTRQTRGFVCENSRSRKASLFNESDSSLKEGKDMTHGSVTKLVTSFGSKWGRIQPHGDQREIFFNIASLEDADDFATLTLGQAVEFDECPDEINGSHAENVVLTTALPAGR
jgi:cold shock CspA family protein